MGLGSLRGIPLPDPTQSPYQKAVYGGIPRPDLKGFRPNLPTNNDVVQKFAASYSTAKRDPINVEPPGAPVMSDDMQGGMGNDTLPETSFSPAEVEDGEEPGGLPVTQVAAAPDSGGILSILNTGDPDGTREGMGSAGDIAMPLVMAGLGMAASRNTNPIGALAEGGILGFKTYQGQQDRAILREDREAARDYRKARAEEVRAKAVQGQRQADAQARVAAGDRSPETLAIAYPDKFGAAAVTEAFPQDTKPTERMRNAEAAGLKPGTPEYNRYVTGDKDTAKEDQINRLMQEMGIDRRTAVGIADGAIRPLIDPVNQQPYLFNLASGQVQMLNPAAQPGAPGQPARAGGEAPQPPPISLWKAAEEGTGVVSGAKEVYARTAGQIPGMPIPQDTLDARQVLKTTTNDLIRSLSINPRFPVAEMERIREEVSFEPSALDSTPAMRSRMVVVDRMLKNRLENEIRASGDPNLPADTRKAAATAAKDIANFLRILGVPQQGAEKPQTAPPAGEVPRYRVEGGQLVPASPMVSP